MRVEKRNNEVRITRATEEVRDIPIGELDAEIRGLERDIERFAPVLAEVQWKTELVAELKLIRDGGNP